MANPNDPEYLDYWERRGKKDKVCYGMDPTYTPHAPDERTERAAFDRWHKGFTGNVCPSEARDV